jgi:glutamate-ammonia-ligase adenylyltransferase
MLRILWRDLNSWTSTPKTLTDLSDFADACISQCSQFVFSQLQTEFGTPIDETNECELPLIILAMGKLGASALNFSSDVDLIYCYPKDGILASGRSFQQFYLRQAQQLTKLLSQVTQDGFVFRVDLRLRPHGNNGALVQSFSALKHYYKDHGLDWERYALSKARVINHSPAYSKKIQLIIRNFVYRNYVDYSAIESLRKLQMVIAQEIKKLKLDNNVKRGAGGIREVEFICQTLQIIQGGKQFRLQKRNTLKVLILLRELGSLSRKTAEQLQNAYLFLRKVENHLQMLNDQQTHELPNDAVEQHRLAVSMGYSNWVLFSKNIQRHRNLVHTYFSSLIAQPKMKFTNNKDKELHAYFTSLWQEDNYKTHSTDICGMSDGASILKALTELKAFISQQELSKIALFHTNQLMPPLLVLLSHKENSAEILLRILSLLKALIEHSIYLVLLLENPIVASQAVNLCSESPWITNQLARFPLLLDELLDPKALFSTPNKDSLQRLVNQQLNSIPEDNSTQQINAIRWFKDAHVLRVAAVEVTGILPLMRVSDYLTDIATVVVETVTHLVLAELVQKHGAPNLETEYDHYGFAVVGYGKLGGIELNYDSDLDLVYLHAVHTQSAKTDGENSISNSQFYLRAAQRITKILGQTSAEGILYTVDLRLRPSGSSGLICHNVNAFAEYQKQQAWCWEHQALTRARPIAGSAQIGEAFTTIRSHILSEPRSYPALKQEIITMRIKARQNKVKNQADKFDIKQGVGGLVDIEFITQYIVLRWGAEFPSLIEYPDNIRILERAGMESLLSINDVGILSQAYKAYRRFIHRSSLQNTQALAQKDEFQFFRVGVQRIWQQCFD